MMTIWKIGIVNTYSLFLTQSYALFPANPRQPLKGELFQQEAAESRPSHAVRWASAATPSSKHSHFYELLVQQRVWQEPNRLVSVRRCVINVFCNPEDEGKNSAHFVCVQYSSFHIYATALWLIALLCSEMPLSEWTVFYKLFLYEILSSLY